jgi:hypothetical protein
MKWNLPGLILLLLASVGVFFSNQLTRMAQFAGA